MEIISKDGNNYKIKDDCGCIITVEDTPAWELSRTSGFVKYDDQCKECKNQLDRLFA